MEGYLIGMLLMTMLFMRYNMEAIKCWLKMFSLISHFLTVEHNQAEEIIVENNLIQATFDSHGRLTGLFDLQEKYPF